MHHQVQLFEHKIEITRDPAVQISYDNKKQIFFSNRWISKFKTLLKKLTLRCVADIKFRVQTKGIKSYYTRVRVKSTNATLPRQNLRTDLSQI